MSSPAMNRYWIPQMDINRKVITQELQYMLGPDATVRPYTWEGQDGYLVVTAGNCLTDEQIDDICLKSREMWEKQAAARAPIDPDKPLKRPLHQPVLISKGSGESSSPSSSTSPYSSKRQGRDRRGHGSRRPYDDRRGSDVPRK